MNKAAALKEKIAEWENCLDGKDVNSINNQLASLLWDSAFYRGLNESRRFLQLSGQGEQLANGNLHQFINTAYFRLSAMRIRALLDRGEPTGKRGVYSLYGLVQDIRKNIDLLTRQNVLDARGLTYEYAERKNQAHVDAERSAIQRGERHAFFISGDGWSQSEHWHKTMDRLCHRQANSRHPDDKVAQSVFDPILKSLEHHGQDIKNWTDKYVAHAATIESRQMLDPKVLSVSMAKIFNAEKNIFHCFNFISESFVSGASRGGVPHPSSDQFAHLDKPLASPEALKAMHQAWDKYCEEFEAGEDWNWT